MVDFTTDPPTVANVPSYSDSKTDIRSFAGITFQPAKGTFSFGLEAGMIGRDLQDTQSSSPGSNDLIRMIVHNEKSLVVNASILNVNRKVALTGFAGYSALDVTVRGWVDANNNGEPNPGESDDPINTIRLKSLPGFTLGGGLTFTAADHFLIRVETDKTWYKGKNFNFGEQDYVETIKPRTENTALGLTYKW